MNPVGPTRVRDLAVAAALAAVLAYLLVAAYYGNLPALPWTSSAAIACLAAAEGMTARSTAQRIARRRGTKPVQPLVVARLVALAKASSLVGAVLTGAWLGVFSYTFLARDRLLAADRDATVSALGVIASVLLVGAALWLEQSCRTPRLPEDDKPLPPGRAS